MYDMGALQPGLPNPSMLPAGWSLLIIDQKDCFFTISPHEDDMQRFAFTLPAINKEAPAQRFEWTVLPQGMRNSPTLCQLYIDSALQPIRKMFPDTIIYHYMDDILLAQENPFTAQHKDMLHRALNDWGPHIVPEKIQTSAPWTYLGWRITDGTIQPQKLTIHTDIRALHDAQ